MTKRILAMLLASLILITSFPVQAKAAGGNYLVSLASDSQNKVLGVGDTAAVTVLVAGQDDSVTAYNAYDLKFSYNAQRLELISAVAADSNADITEADGRIRVKGYGQTKDFSAAAVTITFKAKLPGTADVTITHAKIDISHNAGLQNAPEAAVVDGTVNIAIDGYEVAVDGEGIGLDSNVASSSEDFVFWLNDAKNYDYTISVIIDGVNMTSKLTYEEETGTYTIPKKLIDGPVLIKVEECKPKIYTVTITGGDITGEKTAEYNTDYTFTLARDRDYLYTILVTIGGEEYSEYDVAGDVYTIPGTDITGNIKIKVKKELDNSKIATITFAGSGGKDGSGDKKVDIGEEYDFTIRRKKGYTYSLTVYVDGRKTPYDYDYELDTYYILKENVTGNITIVIRKIATVEVSEYNALEKQSMFLIVYNGIVNEGQVPKYDGRSMYWSEQYNAYVWLVVSADSDKKVKKASEEKITLAEGTAAGNVDYSGNVNRTLQCDLADAKLVREIYEGKHSLDFMEMQKLLSADVCPDKKLNVRDVTAILSKITREGGAK